jgi:hypothetical protein
MHIIILKEVMVQFVRKIIDSKLVEDIVEIPVELKNKKIEMLLLQVDKENPESQKQFDPGKFRGITNIDENIVNEQIKDLRNEWQRSS